MMAKASQLMVPMRVCESSHGLPNGHSMRVCESSHGLQNGHSMRVCESSHGLHNGHSMRVCESSQGLHNGHSMVTGWVVGHYSEELSSFCPGPDKKVVFYKR